MKTPARLKKKIGLWYDKDNGTLELAQEISACKI
jgi:hypothetical protein